MEAQLSLLLPPHSFLQIFSANAFPHTQHFSNYYPNKHNPIISQTTSHTKPMPQNYRPHHQHHVHWVDDLPSRHRLTAHNLNRVPRGVPLSDPVHVRPRRAPLTRDNLDRVPIGGPLAKPLFQRPDPITRENLDQVPGVGFYAETWGWHADEVRAPPRRDRRGCEGWRRRV